MLLPVISEFFEEIDPKSKLTSRSDFAYQMKKIVVEKKVYINGSTF